MSEIGANDLMLDPALSHLKLEVITVTVDFYRNSCNEVPGMKQ